MNIKSKSRIIAIGICAGFFCMLLPSCHKEKAAKTATPSGYVDEDTTQVSLEEAGGDTLLVGSNEYYEAAKNLEMLERRMQAIKSPDMLLNVTKDYESVMSDARALNSQVTDPAETARIDSLMHCIKVAYEQARKNNVVPAVSVLETLQHVKQRLNECSSHAELCRIIDARYGFFLIIQSVHLIVEEPGKMREVHSRAKEVERLLNAKKQQFGVK